MDASLRDKVVLVTGAGSGIGWGTARAFARAGAKVAVADISRTCADSTACQITQAGGEAFSYCVDVTDAEQVASLIADISVRWGRLDILHNNAGTASENRPLAETPVDDFDRVMGVNVKGVWLCMKYAIAQMQKQGGGVIVNTASALSLTVLPGSSPYIASKHAVAGITRSAAVEYARHNIRINAVCPGVIRTPLIEKSIGNSRDPASFQKQLVDLHPVARLGTVDEVVNAVLWLASDQASFVHGTLLGVDGGWAAS